MKIACVRRGAGPQVLLIHGVGGDSGNWDPIAERLRARFDVMAMDLRGHGGSDLIRGHVDVEDFARDALQMLDAAGVGRCHVAGFSLGGAVALALTLQCPERVERLAIIGTVCGRSPGQRARALERVEFLKQHGAAALAEGNRERWFSEAFRRAHPDVVDRRVAQVLACDAESYLRAFTIFCTAEFADRLQEIRVPTLVVTGEHDVAATPEMARAMGERLPDAEIHVLPGLRHSVLIEAPDTIADLLDRFFGTGLPV
ncbi:MAG TPA: alpha/beta fold hydrolase [Casimicrobiaceae bacterium]|jgi:3-oxoadipate enol-lactonase